MAGTGMMIVMFVPLLIAAGGLCALIAVGIWLVIRKKE